jgi:chromosome segregation ATPase
VEAAARLARLRTEAQDREAKLKGLMNLIEDNELRTEVAVLEQALAARRGEYAEMTSRLAHGRAAEHLLSSLARELDRLTQETGRLRGEMDELDRELEDLNAKMGRFQDPLGGLDDGEPAPREDAAP